MGFGSFRFLPEPHPSYEASGYCLGGSISHWIVLALLVVQPVPSVKANMRPSRAGPAGYALSAR